MPFMESQTRVRVLSPPKLLLTLWLCVLLSTVSVRGNYEFTVLFYEFRNPLGLQCGECESGGQPACCDDVNQTETCTNVAPYTCDTRFRFMLRPFGESADTAPNTGFDYFTPSNGGNSDTFNIAPKGFLVLPNPFTINSTSGWNVSCNPVLTISSQKKFPTQGRIQFFIDALDSDVQNGETEVIINRFPIDLELELGANFTERTNYTGIYNIPGVEFDMSFRVQCSENYYGPECTAFCKQLEEVYTCDSEGRGICLVQNNGDPATNCTTCLQGWEPETNCTTCLPGYDPSTDCTQCLTGRDASTNCTTCLQTGYDPSSDCTRCLTGRNASTNCTTCLLGYDIQTDCMECLPDFQCQPTQTASTATTTIGIVPTSSSNLPLVGGVVGGAAVLLILVLVILCVVIVIITLQLRRQRRKFTVAGTVTGLNNTYLSRDSSAKERTETAKLGGEHDFHNPLYDESKQNGSQWEADNSAYSKLQRPPMQKSFAPLKFPYTMERTEEISYQLDVAGKGADDATNSELPAYDIAYPPPPPPSFNETGGAYDVTNHPNHHQFSGASPSALAGGIYNLASYPEQSIYDEANLPTRGSTRLPRNDYADITDIPESTMTASQVPQHDYADIPDPQSSSKAAPHYDYADTALSMSSPPPPAAGDPIAAHEYAEADDVMKGPHDPSEPPSVAYANTTPGQVTPEAMEHYDLGH